MSEASVLGAVRATLAPSPPEDRPLRPVRRAPVAVLVSRFPLVTETFVLRELIELERQGQPVVLVPLLRQQAAVVHPDARPWVERALYTPFVSRGIVAANWRTLRGRPFTYMRLLSQLVRRNGGSPGMLVRTLALFPKTVFLAERLAALGVGHVHAHFATHPGMAAYAIHHLAGLPYSITAHAHDIFVRRDMLREKLAAARFVRCISDFNRQYLAARYPESRDRLSVVHVGVRVDLQGARAGAAPAGEQRLLCVAALKPYKGHSVLVEACRRLAERRVEFVCDLVGDGPLRPKVEAAIAAAGLQERVRVLGARPEHEVAALMAGAAVVVQPSVVARDGQMEGIPVVLMEAMAAGKPVVASALSGVPELVEDGVSGLLVAPGDAEALAGSLQRLLNEPRMARSMGEQGRRKVAREFDLTGTVAQLLNELDRHRQPLEAPEAEP